MAIALKENILEVQPLNDSIPSLSKFIRDEMGYYLCALKDKWVFPFKRTRIKLNIASVTLPDNTIGIISGQWMCYSVETKVAAYWHDFDEVTIVSKKLLPFKIKKGSVVANLFVISAMECHVVEHKNVIEK